MANITGRMHDLGSWAVWLTQSGRMQAVWLTQTDRMHDHGGWAVWLTQSGRMHDHGVRLYG